MHTYLGRLRLLRDDVQSQQKTEKREDTEIIVIFGRKKRSSQFRDHGGRMFQGFH